MAPCGDLLQPWLQQLALAIDFKCSLCFGLGNSDCTNCCNSRGFSHDCYNLLIVIVMLALGAFAIVIWQSPFVCFIDCLEFDLKKNTFGVAIGIFVGT